MIVSMCANEVRSSNFANERTVDACLRDTVKLERAYGGCLGGGRRRRTWTAAISSGKSLTDCDPEISEWGNPTGSTCQPLVNT
jgi:hypothetical protein